MKRLFVVTGLLWGDEGKGATVNRIAKMADLDTRTIKGVRWGGGQTCGHLVINAGKQHEFNQIPSSYPHSDLLVINSETFDPLKFKSELRLLDIRYGRKVIYISPFIPLTTPYEKYINNSMAGSYSTTNTGFGLTLERHERGLNKLLTGDLSLPTRLFERKVREAVAYWNYRLTEEEIDSLETKMKEFINVDADKVISNIFKVEQLFGCDDVILEGHQGVMLDKEFGFYPNVTRANTFLRPDKFRNYVFDETSANFDGTSANLKIHNVMVMRSYVTSHTFDNIDLPKLPESLHNKLSRSEIANISNPNQGAFEFYYHDIELLVRNINLIARGLNVGIPIQHHLVVNCMDQTGGEILTKTHNMTKDVFRDLLSRLVPNLRLYYHFLSSPIEHLQNEYFI